MLGFIDRFLVLWTEGARRAGLLVALFFAAATAFAGFYAFKHLKVNTDTSQMIDPDLPFQQHAAQLKAAFPQIKDDLTLIVRAPTLDEADAYASALREKLIANPKMFSAVFATAEEPFFRQNGLLYLGTEELSSRLTQMSKASGLIETLVKSPTSDTLFAQLATNDELSARSDLGKDTLQAIYAELGDVVAASLEGERRPFSWMGALDTSGAKREAFTRIVSVTPVLDFGRLQPAKPAITELRKLTAELDARFEGRVASFITGDPALRAEELQSVSSGIGLSFGVSFASVWILLLVCYRSFSLSLISMAALFATLILTAGFAAFAVGQLNLVSIAFTVLLTGLGIDFAIHLLLHLQEHRGFGNDTPTALRATMQDIGASLVLAALTTAIAFLSFVPTKFVGIAQLGVIAGVGVVIALMVTLTLIPALLGAFPGAVSGRTFRTQEGPGLIERLRTPLALVIILLGAAALFLLPQARFEADPMALRNPDTPSVRGFNMLFADAESAPYRLTRLVDSAEAAEATAMAAKALTMVRGTRSLPDFVPEDQEEKLELISYASGSLLFALDAEPAPAIDAGGLEKLRARLQAAYPDGPGAHLARLLGKLAAEPTAGTRVQENIFLYWPQLVERLKEQLGAEEVSLDTLPAPLRDRYLSSDGKWRVDILPKEDLRDRKHLDRFVDAVEGSFPDVSGGALQSKKAGDIISQAMVQAIGIALAVIAVFLLLLVRRVTLVALMLFPLALAAALTVAASVLLKVPFNYANVIVLPLLLGTGVDSGIHLVLKNQQIKSGGNDVYDTATPRAVVFSALTTIASFGSLMLSDHRGTASMGALLSIALLISLLCSLIVLPAAFAFGERRK